MSCLKTISSPELTPVLLSVLFLPILDRLVTGNKNGSFIVMLRIIENGFVKGKGLSHNHKENFMGMRFFFQCGEIDKE